MPRQRLVSRPHPDDRVDPARSPAARRRVTVNLDESPLGWLHARGLLSDRQLLAGERLRADFTYAGLQPNVTMRWDAPPPDGAPRAAGSPDHGGVARIDARRRFDAAMAAAGSGLADICWRIICAGEAMPGAERALGWPARSGRLVLALALDRLAQHYRIAGE